MLRRKRIDRIRPFMRIIHFVYETVIRPGCKILSVKSEHLFAIRMPSVASDRWALSELNDRAGVGCGD